MSEPTSFEQNIIGVTDLIESNVNKVPNGEQNPEGVTGAEIDVLDLPMVDEELLKLRDDWEKDYATYEFKIKEIPKRNLRSYLGLTKDGSFPDDDMPSAANLQFESEETFLPAATAQDPAPYVFADNSEAGNKLSANAQTMVQFHFQQLLIRRKIAVMVRQWSIHHLGVLKAGWNDKISDVTIDNRKIQDFIFDPQGYVDVYGDFSSYLGERIYVSASKLMALFPKHAGYIRLQVNDKLGTEVCYTEWWNDDYCFTTFKDKVLDKHKNEYFRYPKKAEGDFEDEDGNPVMDKPRNHFAIPKKPYIFLSVFSLQEHPHDITGLIEQNIPNQSLISRRTLQLDDNISQGNNGIAFSEDNFNQETAKQASNALTRGVGKVLVPTGRPIGEAIVRIQAPNIPNGFFDDLELHKNDLRSSWGTQGISSQPAKPDETARGMVLNQGRDTSRIGGGIVDIIEQSVAKSCGDWLLQLYHVFYDEKHFGAVLGKGSATQYVELSNQDFTQQLILGITANSMQPKDQISKNNEAMQLFEAKAIGPKTLLEEMNFDNPDDAAGDGVLYATAPQIYLELNFPELYAKVAQIMQQQAQQQQQAAQAQAQQEQQVGQQQIQQKQAQGQAQLQQTQASHEQKLSHEQESHQQKLQLEKESASAKMASQANALPK